MTFRTALEYAVFRVLVGFTRLVPFRILNPFLMAFLDCAFRLGMIRQRVIRTNLSVALGEGASPGKIRAVGRRCAREHGRVIAEILHERRFSVTSEGTFHLLGLDHLRDAASRGRGVIILTAHYGNYVLAGYQLAKSGYPVTYVSRPVRNPLLREEFEKIYTKYGNGIIRIRASRNDPTGGIKILKHLRRGGILGVINDQDAGPAGYQSTFLGVPTYIPSGPAHFAFRSGAAVLTAIAMRLGDRPGLDIQPPIDYSAAETREAAEALILDEYSRRLEAKVRECPELYFWYHKKWKSNAEIRARYMGKTVQA